MPHSIRIPRAAPRPAGRSLLALVALFAAGCATVRFDEARLFRPRPCPGAEPQRGGVAGAFTVRTLSIRNADGRGQLEAVVLTPDHPRGVLLFFGGNEVKHCVANYVADSTVTSGRSFLEEAARLELTFVFVNYRGYGASEGRPGLMVGRHDALGVYDQLEKDPAFAGLPVLVHGQSIGVTFAAHVATERPVEGLILESPPTTFRQVFRGVTPWYMKPFLHVEVSDALASEDNRRAVAPVAAPLLVVVGDQDRVTPPAMATRVLRAASSSSRRNCGLCPALPMATWCGFQPTGTRLTHSAATSFRCGSSGDSVMLITPGIGGARPVTVDPSQA